MTPRLILIIATSFLLMPVLGFSKQGNKKLENKFKIKSENTGTFSADSLPIDEERKLFESALNDTYPHLPKNLQSIAYKVVYVINHNWDPITKYYMGWSAEDDPDYNPMDKNFYDPDLAIDDPKNGTIKVVVTQKFIKTLALGQLLGQRDPALLMASMLFARALVAHELLHAWQFHTNPVRTLSTVTKDAKLKSNAINCPDGLCDKHLLKEHEKKIEYERDAFALERTYVDTKLFLRFADSLDHFEDQNPALFKKGGKWFLVSRQNEGPLNNYYFREKAKNKNLGREFDKLSRPTYEGQVTPPQLVYDLKELNNSIEANSSERKTYSKTYAQILERWEEFCEIGTTMLLHRILTTFPYLVPVNSRFNSEIERYKTLIKGTV